MNHTNEESREYQQRRKELMAQMEPNSIALVAAAPARTRSNDTDYYYPRTATSITSPASTSKTRCSR